MTDKAIDAAAKAICLNADGRIWENISSNTQADYRKKAKAAISAYKEAMWNDDMSAVPRKGTYLIGDCYENELVALELVSAPIRKNGTVLNKNSGNYTKLSAFTHFRPIPQPPKEK